MEIVIIAAKSENNVIGRDGGLPWHMPADLDFFNRQIDGCYLLSGRKSYETAQGRTLFKGKAFIVVTRRKDYTLPEGKVGHSLKEGIAIAKRDGAKRLCILGGGEIYRQAMPMADEMIITEIHTKIEDGDVFFPEINLRDWKVYKKESHKKDAANPYDYSFVFYTRQQ
ncbi:MAG: dihydrofolate reductase [Phaeodactylibacter sp.]|nr:dihydrofolate reductase [Phaeodactylibacter sp.]